ncbi:hypothetical protein [uncultured Treponema sp.]|uniref:hypothetical protein n=1 Tax=uncultured Treponema sp. TaxID=162155 RepID=UPI002597EA5C|nr:hypothetical protein [uncultured Treponema sp.]
MRKDKIDIAHLSTESLYSMANAVKAQSSQLESATDEISDISNGIKQLKQLHSEIKQLQKKNLESISNLSPEDAQKLLQMMQTERNNTASKNESFSKIKRTKTILTDSDWDLYSNSILEYAKENGIDITTDIFASGLSQQEYVELEDEINEEFARVTKLTKLDISFLFLATALQCCRQYLLTNFKERLNDQDAANDAKEELKSKNEKEFAEYEGTFTREEKLNIKNHLYNPTLEEIVKNKVPFDINFGAKEIGSDISKFGHRFSVLGHDPILGLIVGTANIATRTITDYKFQSYHVQFGINKVGTVQDKITCNAQTKLVFKYCKRKMFDEGSDLKELLKKEEDPINLFNEGSNGKLKIAVSLIKEIIHLKSDVRSTQSLPIPFISLKDPELAKQLSDYGFDAENIATVGKQATYSIMINSIIKMLHRLFYNQEKDINLDLYQVRTRKILLFSNLIATTSNVLIVAIGASIGAASSNPDLVKNSLKKLDIGGFMVTMYRLVSDSNFILKIKQEFLENKLYEKTQKEFDEIEKTNSLLMSFEKMHRN